jgi:5-methylcytosine-specific restriction protein A
MPDGVTREAVLRTIAEHDDLGEEAFLERYGYGEALTYFLIHGGNQYASKAIYGVAHKHVAVDGNPLRNTDFSGGEAQVAQKLEALGFTVTRPSRNPPWSRDELILALDLYMRNPASPPGKSSSEVRELSDLLNAMGRRLEAGSQPDYRNPNGVYMKMMNFRSFDPVFTGDGKVGLTRGNKLDQVIWDEFSNDRDRLSSIAALIRSSIQDDSLWEPNLNSDDDDLEAPEGKVITRLHRTKERNRKLVERKKAQAFAVHGKLECEACHFDFETRYGERGKGFIEAHHTKPVHTLTEDDKTKLSDLALLCSNCHRIVHSKRPWLSIEDLKTILKS